MDPLSVLASVVGLTTAATKITKSLYAFTSGIEDAPRLARNVICETEALAAIFSQLNGFLLNTTHAKPQRMSFTTIEQFLTLLTHCVLTFSELEEELDGLDLGMHDFKEVGGAGVVVGMKLWDRVMWSAKQDVLRNILADLQQQKLSLSLMIGIWTCKTNLEAAASHEQLCKAIEALESHERPRNHNRRPSAQRYSRQLEPVANPSRLSRISRHSFSTRSSRRASVLSVVSLDQVEDITALSLPLYTSELYNGGQYVGIVTQATPTKTRVRPKSVMFSWTATEGMGSNPQLFRQKSLVRKFTSFLRPPEPHEFEISGPFNARHNTHIGVDPETGKMRVLGEESPETLAAKKVGWMD